MHISWRAGIGVLATVCLAACGAPSSTAEPTGSVRSLDPAAASSTAISANPTPREEAGPSGVSSGAASGAASDAGQQARSGSRPVVGPPSPVEAAPAGHSTGAGLAEPNPAPVANEVAHPVPAPGPHPVPNADHAPKPQEAPASDADPAPDPASGSPSRPTSPLTIDPIDALGARPVDVRGAIAGSCGLKHLDATCIHAVFNPDRSDEGCSTVSASPDFYSQPVAVGSTVTFTVVCNAPS